MAFQFQFQAPVPSRGVDAVADWSRANRPAPKQDKDKTWLYPDVIDSTRWNKLFPYQLMVVDQLADLTYVPRKAKDSNTSWCMTLPIPPEALSISTPMAIATTVTLGGYVEEHSGIRIRMISLSGSTGVFPGRIEAAHAPDFSKLNGLQSIFSGTLTSVASTISAAQTLVKGRSFAINAVDQNTFSDTDLNGALTGYYQMRLLSQFFNSYTELKRTPEGRKSRLAFCIWKDEAIHLVSPISFDVNRSAQSALEYKYSIQLKSTKTIKLSIGAADIIKQFIPVQRDPGKLAWALDKIQQARLVLQNARKTIAAVGGDVEHSLFQPMRELTLFIKDALSVPLAIADLADSMIKDTRAAVFDLIQTGSDITHFPQRAAERGQQVCKEAYDTMVDIRSAALEAFSDNNPPATKILSRTVQPGYDPFLFPTEHYAFFSLVSIGNLNLPPATVAKIARERSRIRKLSRLDFEKKRDTIAQIAAAFSNALGVGSATYNSVYGIATPPAPISQPTDEDWEVIFALNSLIIEINRLVITDHNTPNPKLNSISATAGLAQRSGIAFQIPTSKFAVPFPYGSTLEMLSAHYLGDPSRFHEIVALNGLHTPYVDEEGFKLPILVSGAGNTIMVNDDSSLFTGQSVWIESIGVTRTARRITKINKISDTQFLVTVDGDSNLDLYTTMAKAFLQAFLPGTVNSQMTVFIPSDIEPKSQEDFIVKSIPGIDYNDNLLAVGGMDLLLTPKNDLVITPAGDTKWAQGLVNITQKVRLALQSVRGKLLGHPEYGLPVEIGSSLADVNATDMVRAVNELFNGDPTFAGVKGAHVDLSGPAMKIGLGILVAGSSQVIPISSSV